MPDGKPFTEASREVRSILGIEDARLPVGFVLSGSCERFLEYYHPAINANKVNTMAIFGPGDRIDPLHAASMGSYRKFREFRAYPVVAGLRSAFMVPGIRDQLRFRRLTRKYWRCEFMVMQSLMDHFHLFKTMINDAAFRTEWAMRVLFIPKHLAVRLPREAVPVDTDLEQALWDKLLAPSYRSDYRFVASAKRVLLSGLGRTPVYQFLQDNSGGPFEALGQAFQEAYRWAEYAPIFMGPGYVKPLINPHPNPLPKLGEGTVRSNRTTQMGEGNVRGKTKPLPRVPSPAVAGEGQGEGQIQTKLTTGFHSINLWHQHDPGLRSVAFAARCIEEVTYELFKRAKELNVLLHDTSLEPLLNMKTTYYHWNQPDQVTFEEASTLVEDTPLVTQYTKPEKVLARNNPFLRCCVKVGWRPVV